MTIPFKFPNLSKTPLDEWLHWTHNISIGQPLTHEQSCWLATCIALKGLGHVSPNPLVGAVFLDKHRCLVAYGAHERYRQKHAERQALSGVDLTQLRDGFAYVTLEPCAHQGHQPPCAELLDSIGLHTLYYGHQDPNPLVSGRGFQRLRQSGTLCTEDPLLREISSSLTETFFYNVQKQKPFVAMKVACSLDGKAAYPGDSRHFLTGHRSRQYGHWLRQHYDAIIVGADTVIQDNPTLNVRRDDLKPAHPVRIVLDPSGKAFHKNLHLANTQDQQTLWMTCDEAATIPGVEHIRVPLKEQRFDVDAMLQACWERGIRSLLLEGGAQLWESFLNEKAVQKLHLFQAPQVLGAQGIAWSGRHAFQGPMTLQNTRTLRLDDDIFTEGMIQYGF